MKILDFKKFQLTKSNSQNVFGGYVEASYKLTYANSDIDQTGPSWKDRCD